MGILEEGRDKGTEETFERKMTKNFPKLMLDKTNKQTNRPSKLREHPLGDNVYFH